MCLPVPIFPVSGVNRNLTILRRSKAEQSRWGCDAAEKAMSSGTVSSVVIQFALAIGGWGAIRRIILHQLLHGLLDLRLASVEI